MTTHRGITFTQSERTSLVEDARALVHRLWPDTVETKACLFYACALQLLIMKEIGLHPMLQAGTAVWPMIRPEDDDGVRMTHFGYEWQGTQEPLTRALISDGRLPELHCWLALREPDTVIDPTTGTWPARAQADGHPTWTAPLPPPFLWVTTQELNAMCDTTYTLGVRYVPTMEACRIADKLAAEDIYPRLLQALRPRRTS